MVAVTVVARMGLEFLVGLVELVLVAMAVVPELRTKVMLVVAAEALAAAAAAVLVELVAMVAMIHLVLVELV
jgi:hypothetical protein